MKITGKRYTSVVEMVRDMSGDEFADELAEHIARPIAVWLDDERPMPEGYDVHVLSAVACIWLIEDRCVARISLDHDLGDPSGGTGYDVASAIERLAFEGKIPRLAWAIHSANPVGRERMAAALRKADRYWTEHERKAEEA